MTTEKDIQIFCCGVVQYAMSSGKFEADDILKLTERAHDAFVAVFGKPEVPSNPTPTPAPKFAPPQMPTLVMPEGKDFSIWKDDKCLHWDKPIRETTWSWLLQQAKSGDAKALKAIKDMAESDPNGGDPKWHSANQRRIARAKAVMLMI